MVCAWHIIPLLLATVVLADYYIDNANTSVIYSMPSQLGVWRTFSMGGASLSESIGNSTGNYSISLDASQCYNENYAMGVCGTNDNCSVQVPFTGSGITVYVFNAGFQGMTASFLIDGGAAVSNTTQAPSPPDHQVSKVSLYSIQGLLSGDHTMTMILLNWGEYNTSMKFDYAYVNETLVELPATTIMTPEFVTTILLEVSQTPTQTPAGNSSTSNEVNLGGVIGGTLGGVTIIASAVIGVIYFRKRKAPRREEINPFTSEHPSSPTPPPAPYAFRRPFFAQHAQGSPSVPPIQRSATLRDALATSSYLPEPNQSSQLINPERTRSPPALQPLRRQPSHNADVDLPGNSNVSHVEDAGSPFAEPSRYSITTEQLEVIDRLRADKVPAETIARVVEGFASSRVPASGRSFVSTLPPPSYRTQPR